MRVPTLMLCILSCVLSLYAGEVTGEEVTAPPNPAHALVKTERIFAELPTALWYWERGASRLGKKEISTSDKVIAAYATFVPENAEDRRDIEDVLVLYAWHLGARGNRYRKLIEPLIKKSNPEIVVIFYGGYIASNSDDRALQEDWPTDAEKRSAAEQIRKYLLRVKTLPWKINTEIAGKHAFETELARIDPKTYELLLFMRRAYDDFNSNQKVRQ